MLTIQETVLEIIQELIEGKNLAAVNKETTIDELHLDSLDILDLQMQIEKRLNCSFSINQLIKCQNIQDLITILENKN